MAKIKKLSDSDREAYLLMYRVRNKGLGEKADLGEKCSFKSSTVADTTSTTNKDSKSKLLLDLGANGIDEALKSDKKSTKTGTD